MSVSPAGCFFIQRLTFIQSNWSVEMRVLLFACILLLGACVGKPALDDPKLLSGDFNLEEFFDGRVLAKGQFQDVFGTVRRRFDVVVTGTWDGETLKLVEDFAYADGTTEQRT